MTPSARSLGLFTGLGLLLGLAARAAPALAPVSPFLPPDSAAVAGSAESTPLELRGILRDGDGYRFSIYDPVKKTGQWVRLNEPGHDFTVKTHDVAHDTVTLDYQGRRLTLPLHAAKVVGLSMPAWKLGAPALATGPVPIGATPGGGPVARPGTPEEAARFNRAVEEINRRRALREKGVPPAPK